MSKSKAHKVDFRIYYEDTDAGGVVYYANYLKFAERARTELLRSKGINQTKLAESQGILFVVKSVNMELKLPARLDDIITIKTEVEEISGARINMKQTLVKSSQDIAFIDVKVVCINKNFRPQRIPEEIKSKIKKD